MSRLSSSQSTISFDLYDPTLPYQRGPFPSRVGQGHTGPKIDCAASFARGNGRCLCRRHVPSGTVQCPLPAHSCLRGRPPVCRLCRATVPAAGCFRLAVHDFGGPGQAFVKAVCCSLTGKVPASRSRSWARDDSRRPGISEEVPAEVSPGDKIVYSQAQTA